MRKGLIALNVASLTASLIFGILHMQFLFSLFTPICLFSSFLLLATTFPKLGPHVFSALCLGLGFLSLCAGETLHLINVHVLDTYGHSNLVCFLYLLPSFFYAMNVTVFFGTKLRERPRELSYIIVNSFLVASIGFVFLFRIIDNAMGGFDSALDYSYLAFGFLAFYVCMMSIQTFTLVGRENLKRWTMMTTVCMLIYEAMDIHYIYVLASGMEPDNNVTDFIYSLLIFGMTLGMVFQVKKKYVFDFVKKTRSLKGMHIRLYASIAGAAVSVALSLMGFFSNIESATLIVIMLAYNIMCYMLYMRELTEKQNEQLSEIVEAKTAELLMANEKLEAAKVAAEAASKAKSDFLASMSHEIRTPINTILGMDEMLLRELKDPEHYEYAINIQRAGKALLTQINDILDVSKIEAGKMKLVPDEYNTSMLIKDTANLVLHSAEEKGLKFIIEADPRTPHVLFGDSNRLRQVIMNLLSNAVKYTRVGHIILGVVYYPLPDDSIELEISVKDTGIGIKEEDLGKLFEAFERLDEGRNRTIEGTGLGMNIVYRLLELMDSKLEVKSTYGKGSEFSFRVKQKVISWDPMGAVTPEMLHETETPEVYHGGFVAPKAKILLVDDTEMNLLVVKGLLKNTHMQIDTAYDGLQALTLTEHNEYDALLIDHRMPVMDGMEMIHELRAATDNINSKKPCISLTANAMVGARDTYIEAGFDDFLVKPVNSRRLEETLMKYIPKEKMKISEGGPAATTVQNPILMEISAKQILDTGEGLEYAGGTDLYLTSLRFFVKSTDAKIKEIRDYYDAEDWSNYMAKVHGLKSTARMIGAAELSELARTLEFAAKDEDYDTIHGRTDELLKSYDLLRVKLSNIEGLKE